MIDIILFIFLAGGMFLSTFSIALIVNSDMPTRCNVLLITTIVYLLISFFFSFIIITEEPSRADNCKYVAKHLFENGYTNSLETSVQIELDKLIFNKQLTEKYGNIKK